MKTTLKTLSCLVLLAGLTACGPDTVVHEHPTVVLQQQPASDVTTDAVEANCKHGYDNRSHACY